jgi:hypothetical protein
MDGCSTRNQETLRAAELLEQQRQTSRMQKLLQQLENKEAPRYRGAGQTLEMFKQLSSRQEMGQASKSSAAGPGPAEAGEWSENDKQNPITKLSKGTAATEKQSSKRQQANNSSSGSKEDLKGLRSSTNLA